MQDFQSEFLEFVIKDKILQFGEFTLKSGRVSPYFFNAGLFNTGRKLAFLAKCYAAAIANSNQQFDVLFGPAYKGIPLAAATSIALVDNHGVDKPFSFNKAKLASVRGKVNKNLPATANKIAMAIKPINNNILILCDIFFELIAAKNLNKKYKATKISTV